MTVQIVLLHYSKNGCSKSVIPKVVIVQSIGRNTQNEILCDEISTSEQNQCKPRYNTRPQTRPRFKFRPQYS